MNEQRTGIEPHPDRLNFHFVLKWLVVGVIIFVGIFGGVYSGLTLSQNGFSTGLSEKYQNSTNLDIGERFPDYQLYDPINNTQTTVTQLLSQGPALLVFSSRSCGACEEMISFWRKRVLEKIDHNIQLVWVYDSNETAPSTNVLSQYNVKMLVTDRGSQMTEDGISGTPTLIGLDRTSKIVFIVTGFSRTVGSDFINKSL